MHQKTIAIVQPSRTLFEPIAGLVPLRQTLGVRDAGYGVQEAHCATVGAALLKTLEQGQGSAYTPEVQAAWTTVYTPLAEVMTEAANQELATGRS